MKYYCLSLQKHIFDRFLVIKKESFDKHNLDIKKIRAIDGNKFKSSYDIAKKFKLNLGPKINKCSPILIAIAQSHRKIWNEIANSNCKYNIIFEDDIIIKSRNFQEDIYKIITEYKKISGPKILLIGCLFENKIAEGKMISEIKDFSGLQGYILDKDSAKYLYNNTYNLEDQIDITISDSINIKKYVVNKKLVYHKQLASTAHNQRNIFLESYQIKILSHRIGVDFILNISSTYNISLTSNTIFSILIAFILDKNYYFFYLLFFIFEILIYGGITFISFFSGLNKYSKYDDDEVVNKLIDFILFSIININK